MAHLILGEHPDSLTVRLVHGDGMTLAATLTNNAGAEVNWPAAPSLEFAGAQQAVIATHVATINGPTATWTLTRAQVDAIWNGSETRFAGPSTYVRALLPDGDNGSVEYAGKVAWSDGWTAGTQLQVKTFTRPVPVPGSGGGTDTLTIVNGGTVTLDDSKAEGSLVGYRVKATATFEGEGGTADLEPGAYTFERTADGWTYYAATGTALAPVVVDPPSDWTNLATDTFTAADGTPVLGRTTTTGGLTWVDQQNGADISIQSNAAKFSGGGYGTALNLPLGASYANGVRVSFDYAFSAPGGSVAVGANITWTPHVSGIEFGGGNIGPSGAVPPTGLTGTLSGNPQSGRLEVEYLGTSITVRINGTQVATATNGGELLGSSFRIAWNSATCVLDNLLVEVHA